MATIAPSDTYALSDDHVAFRDTIRQIVRERVRVRGRDRGHDGSLEHASAGVSARGWNGHGQKGNLEKEKHLWASEPASS